MVDLSHSPLPSSSDEVAGTVFKRSLLLEMKEITKRFPGVLALDKVSLEVRRGEVLALMGENGAGKSTLMKILGGAQTPDEGQILLEGEPVHIPTVAAAKALGIGLIHQELMLAPNLDVASNIFLGSERRFGIFYSLDRKRMHLEAEALLAKVGLSIAPTALVKTLTTGHQQMIEICKALHQDARILVMDEPTSSLTVHETERLLAIVSELRKLGVSIVYISHRMEEVLQIADRITVLRDGRTVGYLETKQASPDKIVSLMVGRDLKSWFPQRRSEPGEPVFSAESVVVPGSPGGVSFQVHAGEILGFAGLVGSGRTELMQAIAGIEPSLDGRMRFRGEDFQPRRPADAIRRGIYLVPEDRKLHGLVLSRSIAENISLPDLRNYRPQWIFQRARQKQIAARAVSDLQIRPPVTDRKVMNLSGGNQQKIVLAKWLAMQPQLLLLDEPTRGIDVGAKAEIYARIVALADSGLAILLVSSDMEEILGLSDRVVVMRDRQIAAIMPREQLTKERIGAFMTGDGRTA